MSIMRFTKDQIASGNWANDSFVMYADHLAAMAKDREKAHARCDYESGYLHALIAAREAVESSARREWINTASALAAIDALKEKP